MTQKRHVMHGRDHEYGGADPIRIAWEDVGTGGGGTGGGIQEIISSDASITIANPTGPITDLLVAAGTGIYFDTINSGADLDIRTVYAGGTTGKINLSADNTITIYSGPGISIGAGTGGNTQLYAQGDNGTVTAYLESGLFQVSGASGLTDVVLRLQKVGGVWQYHIKSGATWVADL